MGNAVTAQLIPTPSTNCHVSAFGPTQPAVCSRPSAATQPKASGTPSASPAVMPLSRRWRQAWRRSSSMPAIQTNNDTAHHATPFSAAMTCGLKTKL